MKSLIRFFCVMAFGLWALTSAAAEQRMTALLGESAVNYTVTDGAVTIEELDYFSVIQGDLVIPGTINGLPVISIGNAAFENSFGLTSVVIPEGVTNIGLGAFWRCFSLTNVVIPSTVIVIDDTAFAHCYGLTSMVIPDGVVVIGNRAFKFDDGLTTVTIGKSVTSIGAGAFAACPNLKSAYFRGNAPFIAYSFEPPEIVTLYYLSGKAGWPNVNGGGAKYKTAIWELPNSLRVVSAGQNPFGFKVNWTGPAIVEASTDLVHWTSLTTLVAGVVDFNDPSWANYQARFYRLRSP